MATAFSGTDREEILSWLASHQQAYAEAIVELVGIGSVPGDERAAHGWLQDYFGDRGVRLESVTAPPELAEHPSFSTVGIPVGRLVNLRGLLTGGRARNAEVLVSAHVDTVPAMPGQRIQYEDGTVCGRGAADTKGNIVMLAAALDVLRHRGLPHRDVVVDLVAQEEVGGNGALLSVLGSPPPAEVVVLEPTSLRPFGLTRGYLEIEFLVDAGERHASQSDVTATGSALDLVSRLNGLSAELWDAYFDASPDHQGGSITALTGGRLLTNVTRIHADSWRGSSPATCAVTLGLGYPPGYSWPAVFDRVARLWQTVRSELPRSELSLGGIHNDGHASPPGRLDHTLSAGAPASAATGRSVWNASCDARTYARAGAAEVVVFGCGDLEVAHSSAEHLRLDEWRQGAVALAGALVE